MSCHMVELCSANEPLAEDQAKKASLCYWILHHYPMSGIDRKLNKVLVVAVNYRRGQNRVSDLKREGESLKNASSRQLMLLQRDMKKGRTAQFTAKMNPFCTLIVAT